MYGYVNGNPLSYTDPLGLGTFAIGGAATGQITATFSISAQMSVSWNSNALSDLSQWRIGGIFSIAPLTVGSTGTGASAGALFTYSPTNNVSALNGWGLIMAAAVVEDLYWVTTLAIHMTRATEPTIYSLAQA